MYCKDELFLRDHLLYAVELADLSMVGTFRQKIRNCTGRPLSESDGGGVIVQCYEMLQVGSVWRVQFLIFWRKELSIVGGIFRHDSLKI